VCSSDLAVPAFELTAGVSEGSVRPVILVGFGRMGQRIGSILDLMQIAYLAIDNNVAVVNREGGGSRSVYFGDARQPEVLRAAGVADTPLMVVSIDNSEVTEKVIATACSAFPGVPVFARGHDFAGCQKLRASGASFTVSETLEASVELARETLLHLGEDSAEVEAVLENFRTKYYRPIEEMGGGEAVD
jgi:voltage-gated potassium channel Kch